MSWSAIDVSHGVLLLIGAFYTFAGFVGVKAALAGRFIDIAIAAIEMKPPPRAETARGVWLLIAALLVLAGGLLLLLRLDWAAWAFVASAAGQAIYLLVVAPVFLDPSDPPDARGRQQTINAFLLYAAATAFVLWSHRTGRLVNTAEDGLIPATVAAGALVGVAVYAGVRFAVPMRTGRTGLFGGGGTPPDNDAGAWSADTPERPTHESRAIVVMADYACDPLWAHDPDLSGPIAPTDLALSDALVADLQAWAAAYSSSLNLDDPASPHWSEDQYRAHQAEGLLLARRLKRERPERTVFVFDADTGHTEVPAAEDPA